MNKEEALNRLKGEFTETEKVILSRRSVRQYKKEQVPEFMVKRILEAGYRIHTAERTTSEIMDSLRGESGRAREEMNRIESFLLQCDFVKFAKYVPEKAEHESAAQDALWILEISRQSAVGSGQSKMVVGTPTIPA